MQPAPGEVERSILPLSWGLGLGASLMRPLAAGALVQRWHGSSHLASMADVGVTTWPQALVRYGPSDPSISMSIPTTSRRERTVDNTVHGPSFGADEPAVVERVAA